MGKRKRFLLVWLVCLCTVLCGTQVQAKVKAAIENMTGLECTDVNIRISGIKVR